MEATATSLQLKNMTLSDAVDIRDALVGELHDRVVVFEEDRVVLKAALRQLQRDMRDEAPGHAKVAEDLDAAKDGEIDLGFPFWNPLLPLPVPSSVADSFAARPSYPPSFFFSF